MNTFTCKDIMEEALHNGKEISLRTAQRWLRDYIDKNPDCGEVLGKPLEFKRNVLGGVLSEHIKNYSPSPKIRKEKKLMRTEIDRIDSEMNSNSIDWVTEPLQKEIVSESFQLIAIRIMLEALLKKNNLELDEKKLFHDLKLYYSEQNSIQSLDYDEPRNMNVLLAVSRLEDSKNHFEEYIIDTSKNL